MSCVNYVSLYELFNLYELCYANNMGYVNNMSYVCRLYDLYGLCKSYEYFYESHKIKEIFFTI